MWTLGGWRKELTVFTCDNAGCGRRLEMVTERAEGRYPGYASYDATKMAATQCGWSFTDPGKMFCEKCVIRPPWDIEEGVLVDVTDAIPSPAPVIPSAPPPENRSAREIDID